MQEKVSFLVLSHSQLLLLLWVTTGALATPPVILFWQIEAILTTPSQPQSPARGEGKITRTPAGEVEFRVVGGLSNVTRWIIT